MDHKLVLLLVELNKLVEWEHLGCRRIFEEALLDDRVLGVPTGWLRHYLRWSDLRLDWAK